ncbi:MAG: hypothetical protein J6C62_02835 [Clostridia bacterium]|nr:hypothetical protein [Clostridia bacterium]
MIGNKLYDACRMFKHACSFVDCAIFCEREPKNIKTCVMSHMVACIVNSAFACEVFIKGLLVYHDKTVEEIHGHELYKLWNKYKEIDKESAAKVEQAVKNVFNSKNDNIFDEQLENISNAFHQWRYIYEKQGVTIHIQFLRIFREILREFCCEKFYNKTWIEYIS